MNTSRAKAVELIKRVVTDNALVDVAIREWPIYENDKLLDYALHALQHFKDDQDIRDKDEKYKKWQIEELKKFIAELSSDEGGRS